MYRVSVTVACDRDANRLGQRLALKRRRYPPGIADITAGHHTCSKTHIRDGAGDRTLNRGELPVQTALDGRGRVEGRDATLCRLERHHTIGEGREPQRAGDLVCRL